MPPLRTGLKTGTVSGLVTGLGDPLGGGLVYPASQSDLQAMTGFAGDAYAGWHFTGTSGNEPDLFGSEPLEPIGSPTRGIEDPLLGLCARGEDSTNSRMDLASDSLTAVKETSSLLLMGAFRNVDDDPPDPRAPGRRLWSTGGSGGTTDRAFLELRAGQTQFDRLRVVAFDQSAAAFIADIASVDFYDGRVVHWAVGWNLATNRMRLWAWLNGSVQASAEVNISAWAGGASSEPFSALASGAGASSSSVRQSLLLAYKGNDAEGFYSDAATYLANFRTAQGF